MNRLRSIARSRHNRRMTVDDLWPDHRSTISAARGAYLLQAEHSKTRNAIEESVATLNAAVARASELIRAGYSTEIWSPVSVGKH
jgi:hypothetical protein